MAAFLTTEEVARLLRVSEQTVLTMLKKKEIPSVKVGRQYRIKAQEFAQQYGIPEQQLPRQEEVE